MSVTITIANQKRKVEMVAQYRPDVGRARTQVERVLLVTFLLNLTVAVGKIILGGLTGALAITADGFHSLTDSAGNIAGLVANRFAALPADEEHPYGHHRYETLAALLIGALLLLTAWELLGGIIERLGTGAPPTITPLSFVVLAITLLINIGVSRYQIWQGQRLQSEILLADAANTRADVYVTLSVLGSMVLVSSGLVWADVVLAVLVVGLIGWAALGILRRTGRVLVDTAPYAPEHLRDIVLSVAAVDHVRRVRSRGTRSAAFVDVDIAVVPTMTAQQTDYIARAVRERLSDALGPATEVDIHFSPDAPLGQPNYALSARAAADALGLSAHEVSVTEGLDGKVLEMHVEVPTGQSLGDAHAAVSELEATLQNEFPDLGRVVTHIEPTSAAVNMGLVDGADDVTQHLRQSAQTLLSLHYPHIDWHDITLSACEGGFVMMLHAAMPHQTSIEAAHSIAEHAELLLRGALPQLSRVTIHTEPHEENPNSTFKG